MNTIPKSYAPYELAGMTNSGVLRDIGHWIQSDIDPTHEVRRNLFDLAEKVEKIDKIEGLKLDNALGKMVHIDFHVQAVEAAKRQMLYDPVVVSLEEALRLVIYARLPLGEKVEDFLFANEETTAVKAHAALKAYEEKRKEVGL